ncbi:MAG TPA: amidohydrolase [Firmicutes bacterium]|nr:amidohydrolase [Bacillota bacterium]
MRTIAIEEHFSTAQYQAATTPSGGGTPRPYLNAVSQKLLDLGTGRLAEMDAAGIDMQVLSLPGIGLDRLDPATGTSLARDCNDALAEAVRVHPDRFAGFALLAMQDPEAAAAELERCINQLGFKGAMISGTMQGQFLDNPIFEPVLAQAEKLNVPIYLHPAPPPAEVYRLYFSRLPEGVGEALATAGWGWHVENGLHSLRLVAAGIFDRFPKLQIIIGHMGENLPFSLVRSQERLSQSTKYLQRKISDYFQTNFYLTTSGYFTLPPLQCALMVFGADRVLFAVDYPYSPSAAGRELLNIAPLSKMDLEKIAYRNAEKLLKL